MIRIYAAQGLRRFVLLTGYLGDQVEGFVAAEQWPEPVEIECLDTGLETPTGGRVALAAERLAAGASASPTPTASPTSTSRAPGRIPPRATGDGDDDGRAARTASGGSR